jgi:hypothetical protein
LRQKAVFARMARQADALRKLGARLQKALAGQAGKAAPSIGVVAERADRGDKQESGQPNLASRVFKLMPQQTRMLTSTI